MNNQDYEQKKRECWEEFKNAAFNGNTYSTYSALDFAFDAPTPSEGRSAKKKLERESTTYSGRKSKTMSFSQSLTTHHSLTAISNGQRYSNGRYQLSERNSEIPNYLIRRKP